jgi:hypothetical protein
MGGEVLRLHALAARLEARLLATPLETFAPAATELVRDALVRLVPVLSALAAVIATVAAPTAASTEAA